MEKVIEFVGNNYAWFLTISIILLFALVGYIVDTKRTQKDLTKKAEDELDENVIEELKENSMNDNKSLSDMVTKSKNINAETKAVELVDETILNEPQNEPQPNVNNVETPNPNNNN